MSTKAMAETFLNDVWSLYFHDPYNDNWDEHSYHYLGNISTAEELTQMCDAFGNMWNKGMFFLMREHIKPMWEDDHNKQGGCFSYKTMKPEVSKAWHELAARAVGETLLQPSVRGENWSKVCGVSISPKRNYCIVRIWIGDKAWSDQAKYTFQVPYYTSVMFKGHQENKDFES
jgi:hypothetical protein